MNDSSPGKASGGRAIPNMRHGVDDTTSALNWDRFMERTDELGHDTDEKRAIAAGISLSTYYRMKGGHSRTHKLSTLGEIAKRLGIEAGELVGR